MPQTTNRLAWFRNAEGLTLRQLANRLAPTPSGEPLDGSTISRWERGQSGIPDSRKLELADLFGISVSYLMGWEENDGNGNGHREQRVA